MDFTYQPKWKEELVGTYGANSFTVEITMGKLHVFFPQEDTWEESAPAWAKGKWPQARDQAQTWAQSEDIPFTVDQAAWVEFHEGEDGQQSSRPCENTAE
jgi:hypothetical protein